MNELIADNDVSSTNVMQSLPKQLLDDQRWAYLRKRYGMTAREIQVARLVCCGFGNDHIAAELEIKHATVKTHIRNLYRKLWVHNKISMLLKFIEDINTVIVAEPPTHEYLSSNIAEPTAQTVTVSN
ncbi:MAG: helix-turn-helix transcriptional regulator [Planctomycetes bacterium]|nr:helix-turn-helix transcriptional regulator [Planctomycetota bacterium]